MMRIDHNKVFASKSMVVRAFAEDAARAMDWGGAADTCRMCNQLVTDFTDELSLAEYYISGMCQSCQDSVFGGGEE